MVQTVSPTVIFVNPTSGNDSAPGTQTSPHRTIARSLRRARPGDTVRLLPGTYSIATGETFPLVIPEGVTVLGDEASKGKGILINGGGAFASGSFGRQSVALCMENGATLRGVTVTNATPRGTGIWIEGTTPTISHCTFVNCGREGVFATGTAIVAIADCLFQQNAASGISCFRNSKGELRRNTCQNTGCGIAISDSAAPLVTGNRLLEGATGILISGNARPVLRNNRIERNGSGGLIVRNSAVPDLGRPQDPGGNIFLSNGLSDLRNESTVPVLSIGNGLTPTRVNVGMTNAQPVNFAAAEVPTQILTPPLPPPTPTPPTPPAPSPTLPPLPTPPTLTDTSGHWAEAFIREMVARGMVSGFPDGTFQPDMGITRAQYAALLARAFNLPARRQATTFVDVPQGFWAQQAIARAQEMGFLEGFPDGTFRPGLNLTRVQAIVSLVNGLQLTGGHLDAVGIYRDRAQLPTYATLTVATATQRRIVVNHPQVDLLEPLVDITRAEIAVMIYQSLVATAQAKAIPSPYIVTPSPTIVAFSDIQGHWAEGFIRGLASQDLINGMGDGTFQPNSNMNRAQYAALLVSVFSPLPKRSPVAFSDVSAEFWASSAIQRAFQGRLLSGYDDGSFRPQQNITRLEVLLSLVNGLELPPANDSLLSRFSDQAAVPNFARAAIASATAQRLVVNFPQPSQLDPLRQATRAEVTAMVYQALVRMGRSPAIGSPYIVDPGAAVGMGVQGGTMGTGVRQGLMGQAIGQTTPPTRIGSNLVVLDPGHGGTNTGVIGAAGLLEKDLVLAVALRAAAILKQQEIPVLLTRSIDSSVDPIERVNLANRNGASLFISLHINATNPPRPDVNGLETYYFSASPESAALAQTLHSGILKALPLADRGVRQANFYVLRSQSIPSVHLEMAYLTGEADQPHLTNPDSLQKLAQAIAFGVVQFVRKSVG